MPTDTGTTQLPLARKYRPRRFADLAGQEHIARLLRQSVAGGRIKHAYLFSGTRGVGKTSAARIFARAVNCRDPEEGEPCNRCESCTSLLAGNAADVFEIDAASYTKVDQTREVLAGVVYQPLNLRYKVYIIDEAHMLSKASFNALLKTLEEPPPHVIFILATTEPDKILPTVRSRCQKYAFGALDLPTLKEVLAQALDAENIPYEEDALDTIALEANGSARDGLSLVDQVIAGGDGLTAAAVTGALGLADRSALLRLASALIDRDPAATLEVLRRFQRQGTGTRQLGRQLIGLFHQAVRDRAVGEPIDEPFSRLNTAEIFRLAELLFQGWERALHSPLAETRFEIALLRIASLTPLEDLFHGARKSSPPAVPAEPGSSGSDRSRDSSPSSAPASAGEKRSGAASPAVARPGSMESAAAADDQKQPPAPQSDAVEFKNRALAGPVRKVIEKFDATVLDIRDLRPEQ